MALTFASAALASPPVRPVRLQYELTLAEAVCPAERELKALVSARLGYDPFADQARLTARVRIVPRAGRLTGTLELVDVTNAVVGSKTVDAGWGACGTLAETLALALAIAIDPQVLAGGPRPKPENLEESPPAGEPPETGLPADVAEPVSVADVPDVDEPIAIEESAPPPAGTGRSPDPASFAEVPLRVSVLAGGTGSLGHLPTLAPGGTIELDVRRRDLSLELDGTVFPYASFQALGGQVDAALISASIAGCGWIGLAEVCVKATGGVFRAEGAGYAGSRGGLLTTASLGCATALQWQLAPQVVLKVRLGASLPLIRSSVLVGTTTVWEVADVPIDGSLLVGWALR